LFISYCIAFSSQQNVHNVSLILPIPSLQKKHRRSPHNDYGLLKSCCVSGLISREIGVMMCDCLGKRRLSSVVSSLVSGKPSGHLTSDSIIFPLLALPLSSIKYHICPISLTIHISPASLCNGGLLLISRSPDKVAGDVAKVKYS